MLTGSYRKRLEADLIRWVEAGWVTPDHAGAIRRDVARAHAGFRLPALLGLFGGLLIAASVAAFIAANWEAIPRLVKLAMILAGTAVAFATAARLQRGGTTGGADAATTCGVLIFGAGLALVGQMYHLPEDWPGGAMLVAIGALAAAFLMRSNGALAIAFVALCAWSAGRWDEAARGAHFAFFLLYLSALWIALARRNRLVHHLAVLAAAFWLGMAPGQWLLNSFDYGLLAYGLAVAVAFVGLGAIALDRGGPPLLTACLPWGLIGLVVALNVELARILDAHEARAGHAFLFVFYAYAAAVPVSVALAAARERRFAWPLAAGLLLALLVPVVFWSDRVSAMPGKIVVASLILLSATALVVAGASGGIRRILTAGSVLFGVAILILLWQTIGTLLDQSLFFLVAGAALLAIAWGARRLFARLGAPAEGAA